MFPYIVFMIFFWRRMKKKNSNWYYCNICEEPMREKEEDGLCLNCHLYLCLNGSDKCSRCSEIHQMLDLLIKIQSDRKKKERSEGT
jgi:hypothetical protein